MADTPPILPAHIDDTVRTIARLHARHSHQASPLQRIVNRTTAAVGRPVFVSLLTGAVLVWVLLNLAALWRGTQPWDAPPFPWLQDIISLVALYTTVLILVTQRHEDQLGVYREQLTLELAILSEQKSAKIIELLEEIRRDSPHLHNRIDPVAAALSHPADPQSVLDAIKGKQEELAKQDDF